MKTTKETDRLLSAMSPEQLDQYLSGDYMNHYKDLGDFLMQYIASHSLELNVVVQNSRLSKDYAYQILNGTKKNPSRDKLIPLCLAMHMDLDSAQRALKISKAGTLYSKDKRDAVIMLCFNKKIYNIIEVNDLLHEHGLSPLSVIS